MATRCLQTSRLLKNNLIFAGSSLRILSPVLQERTASALIVSTQLICVRYGSFFSNKSAEHIWDSMTGVSSQGRQRGRASRGKMTRRENLNKGMQIGKGESGMVFPGLNAPVLKGKTLTELYEPKTRDTSFRDDLIEARSLNTMKFRSFKRSPLQRGWTGRRPGGLSVGPPDPVGYFDFEGFDSKILKSRRISRMSRTLGRVQSFSTLIVTGNKNGLIGFAEGKSSDMKGSIRVAKNKAGQRLIYVDRYQGHTLYHNFYEKYHKTSIIAQARRKGHGLVCHRAIKAICELAGIEDLYCKVEGRPKNYMSLTKAFFIGLVNQQTHQELANKTGYNVVEYNRENRYYPTVVARPTEKTDTEFFKDENFDFSTHFYGGKLPLKKKKPEPPHYNTKPYKRYLVECKKRDNQKQARIERIVHGLESPWSQKFK